MDELKIQTNRIHWVDNAKAIAIILVILGHVGGELFEFTYGIHLTCFLLMSGYTLKAHEPNKNYLNKLFDKLMTPYFITSFILLLLDVIYSIRNNYSLFKTVFQNIEDIFFASGSNTIICGLDIGHRIGAIWYLQALLFALVLIQLSFKAFKFTNSDTTNPSSIYKMGGGATSLKCYC